MNHFGIDIGGSGIKGAPVSATGELIADRVMVDTPNPALPIAVAAGVRQVVNSFNWTGPVGCTFPGLVVNGTVLSAPNLNPAWVGVDAQALFTTATGLPAVIVLNDADAAGVAEMTFGAGIGRPGTVFVLTFGTGIGSALFRDGALVPNTELGHLEIRGMDAEKRAAAAARKTEKLSWLNWAGRVSEYLRTVEMLFTPDLFIIGGGVSRRADKFIPLLTGIRAPVVPAGMCNEAGIVGAAMAAMNAG
jgi:polyphosphate glucokinase